MEDMKNLHVCTVPYFLNNQANTFPDWTAYCFPQFNQKYSWMGTWRDEQSIAKCLINLDIKKGDTIGILLTDRTELILSIYS